MGFKVLLNTELQLIFQIHLSADWPTGNPQRCKTIAAKCISLYLFLITWKFKETWSKWMFFFFNRMQHFEPRRLFLIALLNINAFSNLVHAANCWTAHWTALFHQLWPGSKSKEKKNQFTFVSYSIIKQSINHIINTKWTTTKYLPSPWLHACESKLLILHFWKVTGRCLQSMVFPYDDERYPKDKMLDWTIWLHLWTARWNASVMQMH